MICADISVGKYCIISILSELVVPEHPYHLIYIILIAPPASKSFNVYYYNFRWQTNINWWVIVK